MVSFTSHIFIEDIYAGSLNTISDCISGPILSGPHQMKQVKSIVINALHRSTSSFRKIFAPVTSCLTLNKKRWFEGCMKTPKRLLSSPFLLPHFLQSQAQRGKTVCRGGNASALSQPKTVSSPDQATEGEGTQQRTVIQGQHTYGGKNTRPHKCCFKTLLQNVSDLITVT